MTRFRNTPVGVTLGNVQIVLQRHIHQRFIHFRIGNVVTIDVSDILALCYRHTGISRCRDAPVALVQQMDVWITIRIGLSKLCRVIRRAIIYDDDL
ncbi:hypothetical protein D3C73_1556760 [compost metagenome]